MKMGKNMLNIITVFFLDIATTPSSSKSTAYLPTIHPTQIFHPSSSIQNTWQQSSPTTQATMQQSSSTTQGISNFTIPTAGTVPLTSTISPTSSQTQNNGPGTNENLMTNIFFHCVYI